jgi:RNA polymerase sigma-70 factor (ECF subfamily)
MDNRTLVVWENVQRQLWGYVFRRIANKPDTDDILQEVFVRLHANLSSLRNEATLLPWLYKITQNVISDYYRNRSCLATLPFLPELPEQVEEDTAEVKLATQMRDLVTACLPEKYAQALLLSDLEQMTQQEVARQLGLSLSGAKSRIQRARRMLREALLKHCYFDFDARGRVIKYGPKPRSYCNCD